MNAAEIASSAIDRLIELAAGVISDAALAELQKMKPEAVRHVSVRVGRLTVIDRRTKPKG